MWKDYSRSYIKNNRASSISIIAAAFIAALFLSFLCSLFYGFWVYEVEGIILEEGDWQGRITAGINEEDLITIQNFSNVKTAVINNGLSGEQETVVDIYFENVRNIYKDMPLITEKLGLEEDVASFHELLLSRYLIHDPQERNPPLLMTFYLVILLLVSVSLILIIRNSFAISMNGRIHQLGIFSSIGATPEQIRICLIQEAMMLSLIPILLGSLAGTGLSYGVSQAIQWIGADLPGRHESAFQYHPLVFAWTILSSVMTVLCSAWLPARKLSRLTPLEAIRYTGELKPRKEIHSPVLRFLFGIEGELAGNSLKARRRSMYTSTISLTLSFLGFTLILCFFALSNISTEYTYFERYQDDWDIMVTLKDTEIETFGLSGQLRSLKGVRDLIVYQKSEAFCSVSEGNQSPELAAIGGLSAVTGQQGPWTVKAPIVVLDDAGFTDYCKQIGVLPRLDGTIILNRIWDSLNSNFRYPRYVPYIAEDRSRILLESAGEESKAEVPVTAYTQKAPDLREEYDDYALVQFIPLSLWKEISGDIEGTQQDTWIRILSEEGASLEELDALEEDVLCLLGGIYDIEIENRIQEKITNDIMIFGYQLVIGGLCFILALIGIANVFSNTLGFLRQRKREFAQYISIGMTPAGIRKIFCIEAAVIAGRPILITIPLTVTAVGVMIKASYLDPMEFIAKAPVGPILAFCLIMAGFVALAYYLGGKKVMKCSLSEALRDDTLE